MHFVRQLVPLAALFGFLAVISGSSSPVLGNVTSISPVSSGTSITVTASYTNNPAGTPASLTITGPGTFSAASATGGTGVQAQGVGTKEIKTTPDGSGNTGNTITITATVACSGNGPVGFLLLQVGATPNNQSASANCAGNTTTTSGSGSLNVNPNSQATGANVVVNASCSAGATLAASPSVGKFLVATVNGAAINVTEASVTCATAGSLSATYQCTQNGNTTLTLSGTNGASGSLACGNVANTSTNTSSTQSNLVLANPSNSGRSSPVTITVLPETIPCGGSASISVTASLVANAPVQEGTVVNLYTTNGIIEPKTGVIKDGKFITTLKAPATGGVATVNASVGGITNYMDVKFDCSLSGGSTTSPMTTTQIPTTSPLTSSPPPPPPPAAGFPTGGLPAISPPSTGDAGLKALLD